MSAFIVDTRTIDELVRGMIRYSLVDEELATLTGGELVAANRASVNYRYGDTGDPAPYTYTQRQVTPGQCAKSLACFMYQACEHPTWPTCETRELCLRLAVALLEHVPGYSEAEWR